MLRSGLLSKSEWKSVTGAREKPKRLNLKANQYGHYCCPLSNCDSLSFKSQRGCRKHVSTKHGWYYYFEEKPNMESVLCEKQQQLGQRQIRSSTKSMASFRKNIQVYKDLSRWLTSVIGGCKSIIQAEQTCSKVVKFLRFCCTDSSDEWDVPYSVVDYYLGSLSSISEFIEHLKDTWKVGYAGILGYMNSLSHLLDFRRLSIGSSESINGFMACEIYLSRVKKSLSKEMKAEWTTVLSIEYLTKLNCWATLDELQQVIPYHADRFTQILLNTGSESTTVPSNDLTFCTSYIIVILFLMVKAARPMSYQYLTVEMVKNVDSDGFVDQSTFKTKEKYGFNSLIFSKQVLDIVNGYIACIRPFLRPKCDFLLLNRNGRQLVQLSDAFGRLVFQAIGKYVNPTRYRQIIETESAEKLTVEDQKSISDDQKHTSMVAKVHYQKRASRDVAAKGSKVMDKLRDNGESLKSISKTTNVITGENNCISVENELINNDIDMDVSVKITAQKSTRSKKVQFSTQEDNFLQLGIRKYGTGSWKQILCDINYKFHPSRRTSTLFTRAKRCKFI